MQFVRVCIQKKGKAIIAVGVEQIVVNQPPCLECGKSHSFVATHVSCKLCTEIFSEDRSLKNHVIRVHSIRTRVIVEYEAENPPLHCHLCKKGISSEIYQMYHMDTAHAERAEYFNCKFCYWNT